MRESVRESEREKGQGYEGKLGWKLGWGFVTVGGVVSRGDSGWGGVR